MQLIGDSDYVDPFRNGSGSDDLFINTSRNEQNTPREDIQLPRSIQEEINNTRTAKVVNLSHINYTDRVKQLENNGYTDTSKSLQQSNLSLWDKLVAWANELLYGSEEQQHQNIAFKCAFYNALRKSEGEQIADYAVDSAGLSADWRSNPAPLSSREIKKIRSGAESWHLKAARCNAKEMEKFALSKGKDSLHGVFLQHCEQNNWPKEDANSWTLRKIFAREVRKHPDYAQKPLIATKLKKQLPPKSIDAVNAKSNESPLANTNEIAVSKLKLPPSELHKIAIKSCEMYYAQKRENFKEAYPGLTKYALEVLKIPLNHLNARVLKAKLNSEQNEVNIPDQEGSNFNAHALDVFDKIKDVYRLMGQMAYDPKGWSKIIKELKSKINELTKLEKIIRSAPSNADVEFAKNYLLTELHHQQDLLIAKMNFIDEVAFNDPFSEKVVAYSNLLWANAAKHILWNALETKCELLYANNENNNEYRNGEIFFKGAIECFIEQKKREYEKAQADIRAIDPTTLKKSSNPILDGKNECLKFINGQLKMLQLPPEQLEGLTNKSALNMAWCKALNNQKWEAYTRTVLAQKNGIIRPYEFTVIPGSRISKRFERRYQSEQAIDKDGFPLLQETGISSADRTNPNHARNLKVLKVKGGKVNATYIGHGVLDTFGITNDKDGRKSANDNGAEEVIEAAVVTNDRIRGKALKKEPVNVTHVSINVTTYAPWREVAPIKDTEILSDKQEKTYTDAQFSAFNAMRGNQDLQLDNPDYREGDDTPQEVTVNVDVDVIAFSFGINPLATGRVPDFMGGWSAIYSHNYNEMQRYIGDLGTSKKESRVQGLLPGGFIGAVIDQINESDKLSPLEKQELTAELKLKTDTVRELFLSEAFKTGNGDPAKMGREIGLLQLYAEEALNKIDSNQAATLSKNCKSDKDRGGVLDTEIKTGLITRDLGGEIIPNAKLGREDQLNYNMVSTTQLKIQQDSIGHPGSKEVPHLDERIPDDNIRIFLTGLSDMSQE